MKFLSVCSGIEAASCAWNPLGIEAVAVSEIDKFPSAVLAHRYPSVLNLGDMTKFKEWDDYYPDILVGGTPCQSFSVAGLRKGLADPRGNLMLTYLAIADRYQPEWIVWENVPGVLSSGQGRDFGTFLGALGQIGYGWAYRVLDAQFFGVPQRRRRVFVVGHLGDWRRAAAVLFERHSLQRNTPPSREARERVAPTISARTKGGGGLGTDFDCDGGLIAKEWPADIAPTLNAHFGHKQWLEDQHINGGGGGLFVAGTTGPITAGIHKGPRGTEAVESNWLVSHSLRAEGFDASEDGTGRGTPLVPICFGAKDSGADAMLDLSPTLRAGGFTGSHANAGVMPAIAVALRGREGGATAEISEVPSALRASGGGGDKAHVLTEMRVRRLTPRECERLQGFPDDYTLVPHRNKPAADGPRYKALGNSMAVPVMRWIGERIQMVDWLMNDEEAPPAIH